MWWSCQLSSILKLELWELQDVMTFDSWHLTLFCHIGMSHTHLMWYSSALDFSSNWSPAHFSTRLAYLDNGMHASQFFWDHHESPPVTKAYIHRKRCPQSHWCIHRWGHEWYEDEPALRSKRVSHPDHVTYDDRRIKFTLPSLTTLGLLESSN